MVVGAARSAFPVDVNVVQSVDDLKKAIKKEKFRTITCDADKLQLYLAKKSVTWLTENEVNGVSDTSVLTHLKAARAKINVVGLSEKDVRHLIDEQQVAAGSGPVHVLVEVPPQYVTGSLRIPVSVPIGPTVDLHSCDHLLAFLEGEMTNKEAFVSRPHILYQESLEFRLAGRE